MIRFSSSSMLRPAARSVLTQRSVLSAGQRSGPASENEHHEASVAVNPRRTPRELFLFDTYEPFRCVSPSGSCGDDAHEASGAALSRLTFGERCGAAFRDYRALGCLK